jgi:hypothetical protein
MRDLRIWAGLAVACLIACRRTPPPAARSATPATAEACRACNGDFGVHGLDPTPRCLCRTHDAGKRCRGKDECEADCIGDLGEQEVTDPGPPPRGAFVGRCAEFQTTFGCHRLLPDRGRAPAPVRLDEPPAELCVD